ncbi:hypothetical protein NEUTE1DRAFT_78511 [Neurospora tetrasperma FGSC 2508]|uniref:Mid2 domain-containing protein n=1 Tax=Neurospora tetrasperma (strain FGSC 2508 / ATCC MYA-4615 / P0657) TaxID=510951 RepID=F8MIE3_NEUT8|nr:uncharacterized protein NEUTE1DRAFT_78511 [Neurospora tetrasperma FGSC 2508]EGO58947.1 hypothetical protein NEUTE1DRAFT_78511 [Neurospora tetrasperma FGSC 2508]EGZ73047.1 hypothetical protein NEUTE2DRAFT_107138 [Neurospora tetrasperma FGSC 2509]
MRTDFFHRLPPPTAILLLASLFNSVAAHVALPPLPTVTVAHYALDVVSWPLLLPTAAPLDPFDLARRQAGNTICGYIGGLSALPATCSAGSHCVLDTAHQVVGCCPDGAATCTSGVFTACVDGNSGPQSEMNPYVFTCTGAQVCYKNMYEGGASQFGCGTAADQATSVYTTANGLAGAITYPHISALLTKSASRLGTPTTLGIATSTSTSASRTRTSSSASTEFSASTEPSASTTNSLVSSESTAGTTTTSTTTASSTTASTEPSTTPQAPPSKTSTGARTGAIVGGTLGGIAALALIGALILYFLRRRRSANSRTGPGRPGINGKYISSPTPGPNSGFAAVSQDPDAYETGPAPGYLPPVAQTTNEKGGFSSHLTAGGPSPYAYTGAAGVAGAATTAASAPVASSPTPPGQHIRQNSYPPTEGYHYPGQFPAAYAGGAATRKSKLEPDQVPLTREIDAFSQNFNAALGRIGEERSSELGRVDEDAGGAGDGSDIGSGMSRPLWQQHRRQSRNLMWM